jgi:peptide/nickel transport system substrate-binding protein
MVGGAVGALVAACGGTPTPTVPAPSTAPAASAAASSAALAASAAASSAAASSAAPSASTGGAASAAPASAASSASASSGAAASTAASARPSAPAVQAKKGGSLVISWFVGDPPDLDPYLNVTFRAQEFAGFFYSRLLMFDSGPNIKPNEFVPVPDLAESYTVSPDGMTYTFKLRANAKWHNKAPMNGRAVTADDVVYSFTRFRKDSPNKTQLDIVKECKAEGTNTVVFTLNEPFAPFETLMASPLFWIIPKEVVEADGDLRKKTIGSGPWLFDKFEKGVQVVGKRNPDYYMPDIPYVDEVVLLVIPEAATTIAQMRARQIDLCAPSQTDARALAQSNPDIQFIEYPSNQIWFMYWQLNAPPFNDVRVRQAVSLALDREELISVLFEGKGAINSAGIPAGLQAYFLDPKGPDFGPNAKYFKRDVEAAKKLLADAGQSNLKVPLISTLNAYGNTFNQSVELVIKQLKDAGITAELRAQDYAAYISSTFLGKYDPGVMVWGLETPYQEPHDYLYNMFHPKGTRNHGGPTNDETLTQMIEKQMKTLDKEDRKKQIYDIQRYLAEKQYFVFGAGANTTIATQPWVKNFNYQTDYGRGAEYVPRVYLDGKR